MSNACALLGTLLRNTLPGSGGAFDVLDDLPAKTFRCLGHLPLPGGYDEPETLSY